MELDQPKGFTTSQSSFSNVQYTLPDTRSQHRANSISSFSSTSSFTQNKQPKAVLSRGSSTHDLLAMDSKFFKQPRQHKSLSSHSLSSKHSLVHSQSAPSIPRLHRFQSSSTSDLMVHSVPGRRSHTAVSQQNYSQLPPPPPHPTTRHQSHRQGHNVPFTFPNGEIYIPRSKQRSVDIKSSGPVSALQVYNPPQTFSDTAVFANPHMNGSIAKNNDQLNNQPIHQYSGSLTSSSPSPSRNSKSDSVNESTPPSSIDDLSLQANAMKEQHQNLEVGNGLTNNGNSVVVAVVGLDVDPSADVPALGPTLDKIEEISASEASLPSKSTDDIVEEEATEKKDDMIDDVQEIATSEGEANETKMRLQAEKTDHDTEQVIKQHDNQEVQIPNNITSDACFESNSPIESKEISLPTNFEIPRRSSKRPSPTLSKFSEFPPQSKADDIRVDTETKSEATESKTIAKSDTGLRFPVDVPVSMSSPREVSKPGSKPVPVSKSRESSAVQSQEPKRKASLLRKVFTSIFSRSKASNTKSNMVKSESSVNIPKFLKPQHLKSPSVSKTTPAPVIPSPYRQIPITEKPSEPKTGISNDQTSDQFSFLDGDENLNIGKIEDFDSDEVLNSIFAGLSTNPTSMAQNDNAKSDRNSTVLHSTIPIEAETSEDEEDQTLESECFEMIEKIIQFETSFPDLGSLDLGEAEQRKRMRSKSIERKKSIRSISSSRSKISSTNGSIGNTSVDQRVSDDLFYKDDQLLEVVASSVKEPCHTTITPSSSAIKKGNGDPQRHVGFTNKIFVNQTYSKGSYDRHGQALIGLKSNPQYIHQVRYELNEFKREMEVHEKSRANTQYFPS